jgi:iron-sulfur cluster assembly accessory protein
MLNQNSQPETQPIATSETPLVVLSDTAAGKLRDLVAAENNPAIGLRVYVYSGGCSGFRYGMMLEDQPSGEDITVESKGIKVYVDQQSTQYITGSEIDYLDTLMGAGFTVNNPNAVSACGCGSSFRTSESAGSPGACHH